VGGIKNITGRQVDLSDGLFEVTLIRNPKNPAEVSAILAKLTNPDHPADGLVSFKTGRVVFESKTPVSWTLDGEFGGEERNVTIENLRGEFSIAVK